MALRGVARAVERASRLSAAAQKDSQGGGDAGRQAEIDFRGGEGEGGIADAHAPRVLARGDLLPEGRIIELQSESELTVHSTVSAREITLVGPATVEACPGGEEAVRLARGKVTAFPGAGVRPGADVWIATPLGVVRFNDAKIEIDVPDGDATRLDVAVITGQATFVPVPRVVAALPASREVAAGSEGRADAAAPAGVQGETPGGRKGGATVDGSAAGEAVALAPGTPLTVRRPHGALSRWASDLAGACVRDADAARQAAELLAAARDGGREMLADLASAHVKARQRARAACEAAWAAYLLAPGPNDAARRADLERAEATWKGAPGPTGAYQLTPLPARR